MVGYSAGSAIAGLNQLKDKLTKDDVVVVIFHDHGTRYVGKLFNDEWMKEMKVYVVNSKLTNILKSQLKTKGLTFLFS